MLLNAEEIDWTSLAKGYSISVLGCLLLYSVAVYTYRLTWHPLAKYPGPKFAAASYLYEFWFDVVHEARYTEQIGRLHERYGPLIRINPHELHCSDPRFIDVLYPRMGNRRRDKTVHQMSGFGGLGKSTVATINHAHHRMRRVPLNSFFSKIRVQKADPTVHKRARQLSDKLLAWRGRGWFDACGAFNCFTTDAIVEYCYGETPGFLEQDKWEPNCKDMFEALETRSHFTRHLPWVRRVLSWVPLWIMRTLSATYDMPLRYHITMPDRLKDIIAVAGTNERDSVPVFAELLKSDLPPHEKEPTRLAYDSNGAALAGPQSTASCFSNIVYHVVKQPTIAEKLKAELRAYVKEGDEVPTWTQLEQLPYLSAVILEGLRLIFDFTQERLSYEPSQERLARVAVDEEMDYEDDRAADSKVYTIPRGTAVGMSACLVHLDESIYPEATKFIPERWLDEKGQRHKYLDKYLMSFAKGTRFCVGFHMAYCVLYIGIAELVLRDIFPHLEVRDRSRHGPEQAFNDKGEGEPKKTTKGFDIRVV